jgi:hypothetical protein
MSSLRSGLSDPSKFRRGSVERAVAEALGLERLHSYDDILNRRDSGIQPLASPFSSWMPGAPVLLQLRPLLARIVLDQVTLAQEALFADKFNASLGLGSRAVVDLIDRGLTLKCGLDLPVPSFESFAEPIFDREIPLDRLSAEQILSLRSRNKPYFDLARNATPHERFWEVNKDLAEATRRYINDIAASIPLSSTVHAGISTGRKALVSAVAGKAV